MSSAAKQMLEEIEVASAALLAAERDADLAWRDKVSGLRAEFARQVAGIIDHYREIVTS